MQEGVINMPYHSLYFGTDITKDIDSETGEVDFKKCKHTFKDFHLVPTTRPVFEPPSPKSTVIDIPGFDGVIDLSESLTGFPIFNNRTGSLEFAVLNDIEDWTTIYNSIMKYIHGRYLKCIMEDDLEFYYEGRFSVSNWTSNNDGTWSTVTIDYDLQPYKLRHASSIDEWLWDPFNFETGIIQNTSFSSIEVDSDDWVEFDFTGMIGRKPVVPNFIVTVTSGDTLDSWLYVSDFDNIAWDENDTTRIKNMQTGTNTYYDYILCDLNDDTVVKIKFKGHGLVSIDFNSGDL